MLARFSSLKTYLQVWIDLKYGLSPPHVSYQPGATSAVDKERGNNDNCESGADRLGQEIILFAAPGPEHRELVCGQGLSGSECLKHNAKKSSHMWGEGGTPTHREPGPILWVHVLTWALSAAVPRCPARSTAGLNVAPQCRHQQSEARDKMLLCVSDHLSWKVNHPGSLGAT